MQAVLRLDLPVVRRLYDLLDDLQYDAVQRTLRPHYFSWPFPALEMFQKLLLHLPERQRVSYEVLLLGQSARRERLDTLWGDQLVNDLQDIGLLEADRDDRIRTANYSVVSYLGRYFVVSINPYYPASRDPDASVYIGADSLTLAASLPLHRRVESCLDLCAGSGIQAILMASVAENVVAVELNERAVAAARFNAALNGVEDRVRVMQGDLYTAAPDGTYDVIVSNPPFLPVPNGVHHAMCGHGGVDGLAILVPLLAGIPGRLALQGIAMVYAEGVGDAEGPFVRDFLRKLAQDHGLDICLLLVSRLSIKNTLVLRAASLSRLKRPTAELVQWRDLYRQLGATYTYNYLVRIRRGAGTVRQVPAFDPHRAEQGIEIQPGVVIKAH